MPRPYQLPGLVLKSGAAADTALVRALQHDLRALGYLRGGLDGSFGGQTAQAIRALKIDLTHVAPVAGAVDIAKYNHGTVTTIDDAVDAPLAAVIDAMITDAAFSKVPEAANAQAAQAANAAALAAVAAMAAPKAPPPFMLAMFRQESGFRHFSVPTAANPDGFVVLGLDRNDQATPDRITSRGWGLGQFTIPHHPPRPAELADFVLDPVGDVSKAFAELREKFDKFVAGPADTADDRVKEHSGALRMCQYAPADPRYMRDCRACAMQAPKRTISAGTPVHAGATLTYQPTQYYASADYPDVPDRAAFGCDWPYAARRYNGSGVNSYHYQTRILRNLLA